MNLPEFLAEGPLGEIHVRGHRVYLLHIVEDYNDGSSVDMLADEFDTVPRDVIEKVVNFYLDNKAEVDEYVARCEEEMERNYAATPRKTNIEQLQRRLEEKRRSERT